MIIDYKNMATTVLKNFNNGEGQLNAKLHMDELNKILYGVLPPSSSVGLHTHETSSEIIYILKGEGLIVCDNQEEKVSEGSLHYCKKGSSHTFINNSDKDIEFIAVVPNQ